MGIKKLLGRQSIVKLKNSKEKEKIIEASGRKHSSPLKEPKCN